MHEGGRVLGSFMVYQSFAAEADLIDRLAHGEANPLEGIAGTAHNVQGISVGIRMMRGIPVRGGAFVVLGILDVTQTAASDNPADEAYWAELTYSVIRNTLQIACFYLGSAVIAAAPETGPFAPLVALVGLAIMFLADPLLELIGLRDVLNRAFAFEPGDVWDVGAELPELIAQYRVVAGALELMGRRDEELAALGVLADPADVRARARETRDATLAEAHELEEDILEELDEGFEAAETGHVGLMALDYWRREYTQLRWRAHGGTVDEAFMERMRAMEASTSMRGLDADSVRELDLWDDMDAQMGEVESELDPWGSMDWAELSVEVGNLERIFRNARYRLDPASFGELRTRPLLEPGDPGYGEYVARLEEKETAYQALLARVEQRLGASLPPLCGIPSAYAGDASALGRALASLHDALLTYDRLVRAHTPLPPELSAEILYTHSGDAGYAYTQLLETNEGYRRDLTRLQTHVGLVRERMREARRVALAQPELDEDARRELERLGEDFDRIERERQHVRGLLFPHEARALAERIRVAEVAEIGGAFGATRETPRFSEDELAALSEGALRGLDYHSLLNNLERIPALRRGGATEALGGIYCLAGPPAGTE
ncbi:MAG: hypothetical protein K8H88_21015, partial [Sandaracinaceae bacterium]|nr:hypothetical protein [Sandaracinaceae bacterium]